MFPSRISMVREFPHGPDSITANSVRFARRYAGKPCSTWAAATALTVRSSMGRDYKRSGAISIKSICEMQFATVCP